MVAAGVLPAALFRPCTAESSQPVIRTGCLRQQPPHPPQLLLERRSSWLHASTSGRHTAAQCSVSTPASSSSSSSPPVSSNSSGAGAAAAPAAGSNGAGGAARPAKKYDVVALSNLCVDVVVEVEELPPADAETRRQLLQRLSATPPPMSSWEVGGMTNFLIAAARLGMSTATIGHVGDDVYGQFLRDILETEGVRAFEPVAAGSLSEEQSKTLLCFVLVKGSQHAFCSSYDFGPHPLLSFVDSLPTGVQQVLQDTEALIINGFVFDEIPAPVVVAAAEQARRAGAAVFFDPGPRAWTFQEGERRAALDAILDASDVVLMTLDEATAVTGEAEAEAAARRILGRPGAQTEWCIVKKGAEGALLASRSRGEVYRQAALRVDVRDTVGCGDSFAAAVVLGYTRQHSIPAVMALANAVGAATAMGSGAGRNVASADAVLRLLHGAAASCLDGHHSAAIANLSVALSSADSD